MSGGGDGNGFFDKVVSGLNSAMKFAWGYDATNGKWSTHGSQYQILDEGLGEVTGRNASRGALNLAREQFNTSQKQAQDLVDQTNWNKQQSDITASNSAAAATASSRATSGVNPNNSTPLGVGPGAMSGAGAPQKDFLGL